MSPVDTARVGGRKFTITLVIFLVTALLTWLGKIDAATFQKLLGGTIAGDVLTVNNAAAPSTFQLILTLITDGITFKITLVKCRSTKLSMAFARDGHLIPNFDFSAESNSSDQVATIDLGDVS